MGTSVTTLDSVGHGGQREGHEPSTGLVARYGSWDYDQYIRLIAEERDLLIETLRTASLATSVSPPMGNTVLDLVLHVGVEQAVGEHLVRTRSTEAPSARLYATLRREGRKAEDPLAWLAFVGAQFDQTHAITKVDNSVFVDPLWHGDDPLLYYLRFALTEMTKHRTDAQQAVRQKIQIDPATAVQCIAHTLETRPGAGQLASGMPSLGANETALLRVTATDAEAAWLVELGRTEYMWRYTTADVSTPVRAELRGAAAELFLLLWSRLPLGDGRFSVHGDRALLTEWLGGMLGA